MYIKTVTIPRITTEQVIAVQRLIPNLDKVVTLPVIQTEAQAEVAAKAKVDEYVRSPEARYDTVRSFDGVILDEDKQLYVAKFTMSD